MMLKNIWKDSVWANVIAAIIFAIVTSVASYLVGWWPKISEIAIATWDFLFVVSALPNLLIGLVVLLAIPTIIFLCIFFWQEIFKGKKTQEDWLFYKEDKFFNLRWRWSYSENNQIDRLAVFCPHCDFRIFPQEVSQYAVLDHIAFSCDSCHSNLADFPESYRSLKSKVERFIEQKVRNHSWKDVVKKK
jgi:hypothetical protein